MDASRQVIFRKGVAADDAELQRRADSAKAAIKAQHPNLNDYGSDAPGESSSVRFVPTKLLQGMPGNKLSSNRYRPNAVNQYREDLRSGKGFTEPIMVDFSPKSNTAIIGEGNHRLQAAVTEGVPYVPVRAVSFQAPITKDRGRGQHPRQFRNLTAPMQSWTGAPKWPSMFSPSHLFGEKNVL